MRARLSVRTVLGVAILASCGSTGGSGGGTQDFVSTGGPDTPPSDFDVPPGQDPPPSDFDSTVPGTGTTTANCESVCSEIQTLCPSEDQDLAECVQDCTTDVPAACFDVTLAYVRCVANNGCVIDEEQEICAAEIEAYVTCILDNDPNPPDGEGGAGGI